MIFSSYNQQQNSYLHGTLSSLSYTRQEAPAVFILIVLFSLVLKRTHLSVFQQKSVDYLTLSCGSMGTV